MMAQQMTMTPIESHKPGKDLKPKITPLYCMKEIHREWSVKKANVP